MKLTDVKSSSYTDYSFDSNALILGITSDSELTFYKHIILSSKANQKLSDHRQTKNSPRKILNSFITA